MNILFFRSKTFLAEEIPNALQTVVGTSARVINIPEKIDSTSVESVFEQLSSFLPAVVLSVNNAGYDFAGELEKRLISSGSCVINWYTDDPFYEEIFYNVRTAPSPARIDFVTERSFVEPLRQRGFNAHYLPLATDPRYFPKLALEQFTREVAFVGSSSLEFMDQIITEEIGAAIQKNAALVQQCKSMYYGNPSFDLRSLLCSQRERWEPTISVPPEKFLFALQWLIGFFYRRDAIVDIATSFGNQFTCFGDPYWSKFIDPQRVSTEACYYTNLASTYQSTKINLNFNRIQIRTSFTQRVFDTKACGAFLLTERRAENRALFETEGPAQEIVEFGTLDECKQLISYYLAHDDERMRIGENGRDKVLADHTYVCRLKTMLEIAKTTWGV